MHHADDRDEERIAFFALAELLSSSPGKKSGESDAPVGTLYASMVAGEQRNRERDFFF